MTEQTRIVVATQSEFDALRDEMRAIRQMLEGATITPPPEWVGIHEAAKHFGVHPSTIHRKIDKGEIQARGAGKTREVKIR